MTRVLVPEKRIQAMVEQSVSRMFRQLLIDPDRGQELTAYAKRRLAKSMKLKRSGRTVSLGAVLSRYQ